MENQNNSVVAEKKARPGVGLFFGALLAIWGVGSFSSGNILMGVIALVLAAVVFVAVAGYFVNKKKEKNETS